MIEYGYSHIRRSFNEIEETAHCAACPDARGSVRTGIRGVRPGGDCLLYRGGHHQSDRHRLPQRRPYQQRHRPADDLLHRHVRPLHAHRHLYPAGQEPLQRAHGVVLFQFLQLLGQVGHAHQRALSVPLHSLQFQDLRPQQDRAGQAGLARVSRLRPAAGGGFQVDRAELPRRHEGEDLQERQPRQRAARAAAGAQLLHRQREL